MRQAVAYCGCGAKLTEAGLCPVGGRRHHYLPESAFRPVVASKIGYVLTTETSLRYHTDDFLAAHGQCSGEIYMARYEASGDVPARVLRRMVCRVHGVEMKFEVRN